MSLAKTIFTPLRNLINRINACFLPYRTFTYYVPAPPSRNTPYREKKFDQICFKVLSAGFEIVEFKTVAHQSESQNGFWAIFILSPISKEAQTMDLDLLIEESTQTAQNELEIEYD